VYRLNSVFDPDYTGTGVPAYGLAALSNLYGQYLVHGAKISIEFASGGSLVNVAYTITDALLSPPTNLDQVGMERNSRMEICGPSSGLGIVKFQDSLDVAKYKGHGIDQFEALAASTGANPSEVLWLIIYAQATDLASTVQAFARVSIDFDVEFRLPISPLN
jgi:hypothetical protein